MRFGRGPRNESGQGTIEYILLIAMVAGLAGLLNRAILGSFDTSVLKLGGALEKRLRTGKADVTTWNN